MIFTVDWSLLGNPQAREGGAVKFFQIRQATCEIRRVRSGARRAEIILRLSNEDSNPCQRLLALINLCICTRETGRDGA